MADWKSNIADNGTITPIQLYNGATMQSSRVEISDSIEILPKSTPIVDGTNLYGGEVSLRCDSFVIMGKLVEISTPANSVDCEVEIQRIGQQIFYKMNMTQFLTIQTANVGSKVELQFPSLTTQEEKDDFSTAYMTSSGCQSVIVADGPTTTPNAFTRCLLTITSSVGSPATPKFLLTYFYPATFNDQEIIGGADDLVFDVGFKIQLSNVCFSQTK